MTSHLEETLQRDLNALTQQIAAMAEAAERALNLCLRALEQRNRTLAYAVILGDQRIDEMEKETDRLCLEFLVRQQPAGAHLRFIYGAIKINAELERIGDYAESVARQILKTIDLEPFPERDRFSEIGRMAVPMLRDAVRAFLSQDAELARRTMDVESQADELRNRINAELLRRFRDERLPLEMFTPLMTIARRFERVCDQAKNICEEALYVCTGESAKHLGAGTWRVLFLDPHGHCLGLMAEAIGRSLKQTRLQFSSAGLDPRPADGFALTFLAGKSIDTRDLTPRPVAALSPAEHFPVVITLGTTPPAATAVPAAKAVHLHWTVADPSLVSGTPEQVLAAYETTCQFLSTHIRNLADAVLGEPAP